MDTIRWMVAACLGLALSASGAVWHVDGGAGSDQANGQSWATAFASVTQALNQASADDEVWVREGTYYTATDGLRTRSFALKAGVALYGGFAGTETIREARDWSNRVTVLSGDLGTAGVPHDNAYHVVVGAAGARLDGFTVRGGYADGAAANRLGGGLYFVGAHLQVANCRFLDNAAIGTNSGIAGGGGVYWDQGAYLAGTASWVNCNFSGNLVSNAVTASYGAAFLASFYTNMDFLVSNCVFEANAARGQNGYCGGLCLRDLGGRNWPAGAGPVVADSLFLANVSVEGYGGGLRVQDFRAPVYISGCRIVSNRTFTANNSLGGGGLHIRSLVDGAGLRVTDCLFEGNHGGWTGGGVSFETYGGTNSLWRNCLFTGNMASNHGGAVAGAVDGTFDDCRFVSNRAFSYNGGAVRVQSAGSSSFDLFTNCLFLANQASVGGAFSAEAPVRLEQCRFLDSAATNAGALYWSATGGVIRGCDFINSSVPFNNSAYGGAVRFTGVGVQAVIDRSTFVSNAAGWYGGAFHLPAGGALTVSDSLFSSNRSIGYYGGAALIESSNVVIRRCVFVGNDAAHATYGYGGALCFRTIGAGFPQVENSVFLANTGRYGGAVCSYNANVVISNCTLAGNAVRQAAGGGGLYIVTTTYVVRVENTICWGNRAAGVSGELQPAAAQVRYSCVEGGHPGTGVTTNDPLFLDGTYLHLRSANGVYAGGYFSGGEWTTAGGWSPLIDAGDPASPFAAEPSPNGGRINMGAYGNTPVASRSRPPRGALIQIR